ncbi:hypothetical protein KEM60_02320 [Austwickia sp. TVS 96-490-7B]|uniref:1-acyl-sn-glycerol-3-phosphate acyltransferase n=1 Tax=Austwickia sp. TVS 96-490-7B TaxID=2830843 RepID=UPI001C57E371|nr:hypothetical protein [Austwickia sp. TVS 96-490-7B]
MFYWLMKVTIGPVLTVLFRPKVEGIEHIPERGAAILASNHLSFSDSFFLPLVLRRRITFPAKMEYFTGTGVKGRLTAAFFRGVGQIPIDRSGGSASWVAMEGGLDILRSGELFGIYPEGTRSPDGRLYRGKTGVARLALEAGVPIIPVAMIDTDKAQPTGQIVPTITQIGIRIGEPLDVTQYVGQESDHLVLRRITDEVMQSLQRLSGQEYVDEYAADRKRALQERAERMMAAAKAQADAAAAKARAEAAAATARAREEAVAAAAKARAQADEYAEWARTEYAAAVERAGEATARAKDEYAAATERLQAQVAEVTQKTRAQADEALVKADGALTKARAQAVEATGRAFASVSEGAALAEGWFAQARADSAARAEHLQEQAEHLQEQADEKSSRGQESDQERAERSVAAEGSQPGGVGDEKVVDTAPETKATSVSRERD